MEDKVCDNKCNLPLAYAWIQIQEIKSIYSSEEALQNGTLFPELNLPLGVYGIKEWSAD